MAAAEAGADAVGFVFYSRSPRAMTAEAVRPIAEALPPFVQRVGLFVNEHPSVIEATLNACSIDLIQFHGSEDRAFCESFGVPYIKAFGFESRASLDVVSDAHPNAVALLVDAVVTGAYGGTGQTLHWPDIGDVGRPWLLAGGLTAQNVCEAIEVAAPFAVDVSSGVESSRGVKDVGMIRTFIQTVNQGDVVRSTQK
jgi:phosphoribosylanthranilate isomerase